jgi:hypothetical protein
MTKVNRHRTYSMTPEWRIIAESLVEPSEGILGSERLTANSSVVR